MLGKFIFTYHHERKAHVSSAGLTLLSLDFFATGQDLMGAFFFVLSLGFKQMTLYYAPAIGSYLLAKCLYLGPIEGYFFFLFLFARLILNVCIPAVGYLFVWRSLLSRLSFFSSYLSFRLSPLSLLSLTCFLAYSHFIEGYLKIRLRIFGVHLT